MKRSTLRIFILIQALYFHYPASSQCGAPSANGTAGNMFTHIRNSTNPVAADKNLNTVVFIHRNNPNGYGGNTGQLRYDVSTNAGSTWTIDQGVLNPLTTNLARYPNVTIYNPSLNVNPSNAYLGYMAATIDPTLSTWNGLVSGVRQLNGGGNTEFYNQPVINPQLIPHSVVKGAHGVFWGIDGLFNGSYITGFTVYKGQWNGNDITWTNNFSVNPPFNLNYAGIPYTGDYNIAFDPTGNIGWFSFLGHVSPGPGNYAYYPVFYKTTNGGATWTGPIQVDLTKFSCMTSNMVANSVVSCNFEHDLVVDANGNPHFFTTICNGTNVYSVTYGSWHHMYDITLSNDMWIAHDVADVKAGRGTWGIAPNQVYIDMAPQAARSADGTKVFFTWSDNANYTLGDANLNPNLFGRSYDVSQNKWTPVKDFSSCSVAAAGKMLFPHIAPEVLEPSANVYKVAPVYTEFSVPGDPLQVSNFYFLDNVTFASAEYSINPPAVSVNILPSNPLMLCPGSTLNLSVSGLPGQMLWSNGSTLNVLPVSNSTVATYSVIAQKDCQIATASVAIVNLTMSASAPGAGVCPGKTVALSVAGNAFSYTWQPGNIIGTNAVITASTVQVYTVTGSGSGNCNFSDTVSINLLSLPVVSITGNDTLCTGSTATLQASGAATYSWSNGMNGNSISVTPALFTVYSVTGTAANSCINTKSASIYVFPSPNVSAFSSNPEICAGVTATLTANGALTYSWPGHGQGGSIVVSPTISTTFSVIGTDANSCTDGATVGMIVHPGPTVTITSPKTLHCKGEKPFYLIAGGASSYTWTHNGIANPSLIINPVSTIAYSVTGLSAEGCAGSAVHTVTFSNCTGILNSNLQSGYISVFPNPNEGNFTIKSDKERQIEIVNMLGQIARKFGLLPENRYSVEVTGLAAGVYFIRETESGLFIPGIVISGSR